MKIRHKILLFVLTGTVIVFIAAFGFLAFQNKETILKESKKIVQNKASEAANYVTAKFDNDMGACRALADAFVYHRQMDSLQEKASVFMDMQGYVAENNPDYIGVWSSWQLSEFDPKWGDRPGRISISTFRKDGRVNKNISKKDIGGITNRSAYHIMMEEKEEQIWVPYFDVTIFTLEDQVLETTMAVPVMDGNTFEGMVGIDVELRQIQQFIKTINPYENSNSFAILISQDGAFVSHPVDSLLGKVFSNRYAEDEKKHNIVHRISEGKPFNINSEDFIEGEDCYVSFAPIKVGRTNTPWSIGVVVPMSVITEQANMGIYTSLIAGLIGLILLIGIIWYISGQISKPIISTTKTLKEVINTGNVDASMRLNIKSQDELGQMSTAINNLIENLRETAKFAKEIGNGNYEAKYTPLSEKDVLGNSLIEMRESFKKNKHEESIRKEEERKRNWMQEGLAKFGDILRLNNDNLKELSYQVIMSLVKYVEANQGGLFILTEEKNEDDNELEEKYLELMSCFAYNRKKFLEKRVNLGEGLIGACILEKKSTYLKDIPDDYISITSGLGDAPPNYVLIVPLLLNDEAFGVIEMASFNKFEDHVIEFVEKVGENIASSISSVKINIRTAKLLEQSQHQSEQLRSQEEEMRQNMEELQATQEEMARKNAENESVMSGIDNTLAILEFDMNGNIQNANKQLLKIFGMKLEELIGINHNAIVSNKILKDGSFQKMWNSLKVGESYSDVFEHNLRKGVIYTQETLTPIKDSSSKPYKVMAFIVDITEQKKLELKTQEQLKMAQTQEEELREHMERLHETQGIMKQQEIEKEGVLNALNASTNMVEYNLDGYITFVNDSFLKLLDLKREEVIGKHHRYKMELPKEEEKHYDAFWNELTQGKTKQENTHYVVNGKTLYLMETYTPIKNSDGKVYKILKIALDITESKLLEQQLKQHSEELKAQEEELKQSMEELDTIEHEVSNKTKEHEKITNELDIKSTKLKSAEGKLSELKKIHAIKEKKLQDKIKELESKLKK